MTTQRVAIVTGGSSGLGAAICEAIAADFHRVINCSLKPDNNDKVIFLPVDLQSEEEIKAAMAPIVARYPKIDLLINCAGVNHIEWIPKMAIEDWDRIMNVNARALWLTAKHLCDHMKGGTIINIVSNAATVPMTNSAAYCASKAAALQLTKVMARELGKTHDITCFSISPNKLRGTGMSNYIESRVCELRGWSREEAAKYQLAALPSNEETDPRTVAEFIAYLVAKKENHKHLQGCDLTIGGPN